MKNEEVQEIIDNMVERFPYSKCGSGRLIHEQAVWCAVREAFNRGFERGEKRGEEKARRLIADLNREGVENGNI